jgi:hypothetical protein
MGGRTRRGGPAERRGPDLAHPGIGKKTPCASPWVRKIEKKEKLLDVQRSQEREDIICSSQSRLRKRVEASWTRPKVLGAGRVRGLLGKPEKAGRFEKLSKAPTGRPDARQDQRGLALRSLRPRTFDEFVGGKRSATSDLHRGGERRGEALDHVLLTGLRPGQGEPGLPDLKELGSGSSPASGPVVGGAISRPFSPTAEKKLLFIDEIHRLTPWSGSHSA